jgi:hypothetical protein
MDKTLPIPPLDAPGLRFLRDGFTAAYLFDEQRNRLFLLDPRGTMSEIRSRDLREVILAIGEGISRREALLILESEREVAAAV